MNSTEVVTAAELAEALDGRPSGRGWMARCPAHDDRTPSLSIREADDGRVLVRCHAGCTQEDVIGALQEMSLWYRPPNVTGMIPNPKPVPSPHISRVENGEPTAIFHYVDADGITIATKARFDGPDGTKRFQWGLPDDQGWTGLHGMRTRDLPLYGLRRLVESDRHKQVWVVEGEKCVDALEAIGEVAVSLPGGAAQKDFGNGLEVLKGRIVTLFPDNDQPGQGLMIRVAAKLMDVGGSLMKVDVASLDLPEGGDVADFLYAGGELPDLNPLTVDVDDSDRMVWSHRQLLHANLPPLEYVIEGLVVDAGLTLLGGKKKTGKSWMALQMAQTVAEGEPFLGRPTTQGSVIYFALEDGPRRLSHRLNSTHAAEDLPIRYRLKMISLDGGNVDDIEKVIEMECPRLVIIDTLAAAKSGKADENAAGPMADITNALRRVAQRCGVAIVLVVHHGKRLTGNVGDDVRGSSASAAAADVILGLYKKDGKHVLEAEGRDIEDASMRLDFDADGSWGYLLVGDHRRINRDESDTEIIRAVAELGEADAKAVADALNKTRQTVHPHLRRLVVDGRLTEIRDPAHNQRILFRLAVDSSSPD